MIHVNQVYKTPLNDTTVESINHLLDDVQSSDLRGEVPDPYRKQLMNYISKLAKTCFDKGLAEGKKNND